MHVSFGSLVVGSRLLRWGVLVSSAGCARFGYDLGGSELGSAGAGAVLQDGSAGSGGSLQGGAGGTGSPGGAGPSILEDGGAAPSLSDAGTQGDAGWLPPCRGGGAFAEPVVLDGLPSPPLFGPSLSADGRTLFFAASGDLYSARRARIDDTTFGDVRPLSSLNSNLPELTPRLSRDGRTLYFARDSDGTGFFRDLMQSRRPSPGDPFGSPSALTALNDPFYSELSPEPSFDGDELLFSSSRPGGPGLFDIWRGRRSSGPSGGGSFDSFDSFGDPQPVASLSSPEDDSGVTLTGDGSTAVLSSARSGGLGSRDLWLAARPSRFDDFTLEANLTELNTPENDTDPAWRSDGGELLFASDRSGASLLYSAVRPCQR